MTTDHDHGDTGHCGHCKWWQGEPTGTHDLDSPGVCQQEELVHFQLAVSAGSGCNRFEPATVGAGISEHD
ncbi:MAG: hypothetical protein U0871_16935 [Gemmataceae bacterium]